MRVVCKFASVGSAGVQRAVVAVADELAAGVCADKRAGRSKIGKKITAQFSKHEFWAVFVCSFLGEAKH